MIGNPYTIEVSMSYNVYALARFSGMPLYAVPKKVLGKGIKDWIV